MVKQKTDHRSKTKKKSKIINVPTGNIDKDFNLFQEYAIELLKENKGLDPAIFIIDSGNRKMGMISGGGLPADPALKELLFERIGRDYAGKMPNADGFIMVMEAWAEAFKDDEPKHSPSESPDRVEVFIVAGKKFDGSERCHIQAFTRDKAGEIELVEKNLFDIKRTWHRADRDGDDYYQNKLLNILWRQFMLARVLNNLK